MEVEELLDVDPPGAATQRTLLVQDVLGVPDPGKHVAVLPVHLIQVFGELHAGVKPGGHVACPLEQAAVVVVVDKKVLAQNGGLIKMPDDELPDDELLEELLDDDTLNGCSWS